MGIAATPRYMDDNAAGFYDSLSPAAKFYTFFPVWKNDWSLDDHAKNDALNKVLPYSAAAQAQTKALIARQDTLMANVDPQIKLSISAKSLAPFMTGTGMEHPLENGFAFIQPYGLPYLAGSGVKGVLRNTARLLAQDAFGEGAHGWTAKTEEALFGSDVPTGNENSEQFLRGALTFWDVIVSPKVSTVGGKAPQSMSVDILTPHQSHYLQGTDTPHDSGQPIPVPFLCVAAGAEFNFHITANPHLLEHAGLTDCWQDMLQKCFEYTFDWFGFGAKTAVGYGVLELNTAKLEQDKRQREEQARAEKLKTAQANLSPNQAMLLAFETNLPEESKWKGKGPVTSVAVDIDGKKYGFAELCTVVETWQDHADIQAALTMFEAKLPIWFGKPIKENKKWKERINTLKRQAGLL